MLPILSAVAAATFASQRDWGILNQFSWPVWIEFGIVIVLMDMLIYWQHVASHHILLHGRIQERYLRKEVEEKRLERLELPREYS